MELIIKLTKELNTQQMDNATLIALITAFLAFFASMSSIYITRKNNSSNVVSKNRLYWINDVRTLLFQFIDEYMNNNDKAKMKQIMYKVMLYTRDGVSSYKELLEMMNLCIEKDYSDEICSCLIKSAQKVFSEFWIRMKREAGIRKIDDNRFTKMFENTKK